jgi:hypothetical protein
VDHGTEQTMSRPSRFVRVRDVVLGSGSTLAIMFQPHIPLQLPGYRALMWLALLFVVRLYSGRGWAATIGMASAVGTLAVGRSPDGVWGILQYVIAGVLVDAALTWRPSLGRRTLTLAGVGAVGLLVVGWIAPIGQGFSGGAGIGDLWYSLQVLGAHAWIRLLGFDVLFGAGAGLIAAAVVWAGQRAGAQLRSADVRSAGFALSSPTHRLPRLRLARPNR